MPDSAYNSRPGKSRVAAIFMALLGLVLHLAIAFPFAFGAYAILGMLQRAPEQGSVFIYVAAGVCFVASLIISCIWYRLRNPCMEDADSAALFLFPRGIARIWSGR